MPADVRKVDAGTLPHASQMFIVYGNTHNSPLKSLSPQSVIPPLI